LPVGGDERGGPDDGGPHAAGAVGLLPGPAAGGELPRRAGHRVDAARRDGRAPQGRGARAGHAEHMSPRPKAERRRNRLLREVLDDLLDHTRAIVRRVKVMTPAELDYAQQRLEWLADEVWRVGPGEPPPEQGVTAPAAARGDTRTRAGCKRS